MEINLDFEKESMDILKLKQQDDRTLIANIFSDSVPFDLAGSTVKVNASNYLGQAIIQTQNIAISGNKVTINLIRDITRVSGMTKLELAITKSNKQLTTFTFYLDVKQSVLEGANLEVSIVADIIEVLTTKIDEAVKCKEETERLIATGNAATKGDIAEVNSHLDSIKNEITNYGAIADGTTPCDSNYDSAKLKGKVHFPQNSTNNAIYFFTNSPNFDGIKISCDEGVKISLPTTNSISFKYVQFTSDVQIISRDRNNTGIQFKNDTSDLIEKSFCENDIDVGYKDISVVVGTKNIIYTANTGNIQEMSINVQEDGMFDIPSANIPHSTSKVLNIESDVEVNVMYSADYEFIIQETETTTSTGITISDGTNANWIHWGIRPNGSGVSVGNINGSVQILDARNFSSIFTDAYKTKYGFIYSYRVVNKNKIQLFINGVWLQNIVAPFEIKKVGFSCMCVNSTGHGTNNLKIGRIVKGYCNKINIGNSFNIVGFGDSMTFGEGALSWLEYLPSILEGQRGLVKANVTNKASSGNSTVQQLPVMRATNLDVYDCVCVMIGTNDIQFETPLDVFTNNIREMITLAKGTKNYRKVIFGIPPLWISQQLTGEGAFTSNFDKGAKYRSIIMYECAKAGVLIADVMSEIGRINTDSVKITLRDNLHPNCFGEIQFARCFARSIIKSLDI